MKKQVILLLLLLCISVNSYSQIERVNVGDYVYMRVIDNNFTAHSVSYRDLGGMHACIDESSHVKIRPSLYYSLEKTKRGIQKRWFLKFNLHSFKRDAFSLKNGDNLLLKLFDDSIITLITSKVDISSDEYGTFLYFEAKLTDTELNKISSIGVKKLRIETIPYVCDAVYDNDEIGTFVINAK